MKENLSFQTFYKPSQHVAVRVFLLPLSMKEYLGGIVMIEFFMAVAATVAVTASFAIFSLEGL
jgi:hypothetical protein